MLETLLKARGILHSLRTYYGIGREGRAALDALYRQFVRDGDLVFDIGAHVGDRVAAFRRLGARVVAVEPQPPLTRTLRLVYGRDAHVKVVSAAVGAEAGEVDLLVNLVNPTVATASKQFVEAARGAPGWEGQEWTRKVRVPMTTLDALIARYGEPAFIKIDVEGYEANALAGLSRPVRGLSFEFTTIQREVALAALNRCSALGYRRFDAAIGETAQLVHRRWLSADEMRDWLLNLPHEANSGDVYAVLD